MDPFRVRLNCIDSYQASPTKFDPLLRNDVKLSQLHKEPKIPVIRVFGSTETGQKVCAHIHGAFPYLYIEYTGSLSPAEGTLRVKCFTVRIIADHGAVGAYIHRLHLSIDYALSISYKRDLYDGSAKYVARITLVKGIPFYGFHVGYRYYLKVYALDPKVMNRLADLLRQGVIMKKIFQPLEAHLQYLLQWMADYNLYGCGYINCSKVVFRSPVPQYEELVTPSHLWHDRSIPDSSISEQSELPRVSHCAIEVDICVQDIINRHHIGPRPLHHNFIEYLSPPAPHGKLVRSMESLWREEASRRKSRMPEVKLGSDPFAADMLNSMSAESRISQTTEWIHESEYRDKVMNLIVDERSKSDGEDVSFTTFVKHNPFESTIKTSLEAVEDLFPENLRTSLGLSPETSPGDTDYSISGQEDREVDEKRILTFGLNDPNETIFDSDEDVMQERNQNKDGEYTEGKRLGQADTVQEEFEIDTKSRIADNHPPEQLRSPSDPNVLNPISRSLHADITAIHTVNEHPRSGVLESGHISGTSDLALRRHPPILPYSAPAEKDLPMIYLS
jgi:DNA polymerase zeta